jgi:hypothetical protein
MRRKSIGCVVFGVVFLLVLAAGTADASERPPSVIVFTVANLGPADCGLSFDMVSPAGNLLGRGVSCIHSIQPPDCSSAGCRDTVDATFTLPFADGSLAAPILLNEHWLSDSLVLQVDRGTVTSGTGAFAGATGSIFCAGTVQFTATAVITKITCIVHLD